MNGEPKRLVDDPEIGSSLRDDLARAGEEHHAYASSYDAASKAAGFQAVLAGQGGGATGVGLLVKVAAGTAAAAAFMFAGAALHARFFVSERAVDSRAAAVSAPAAAGAPAVPEAEAAPIAATAQPVTTPARPSSPPARRTQHDGAQHDGAQHELRQLARIREHLRSGDAQSALELAERGQRELRESALWQEREALAVLALFDLDRTEQAEQRSARLLARFPDSPFRAELEHRSRRVHDR